MARQGTTLQSVFGSYVSTFSSYNKTYGSLAGVIVFLLWLWITNLALPFGAEVDAELGEHASSKQGPGGTRGRRSGSSPLWLRKAEAKAPATAALRHR